MTEAIMTLDTAPKEAMDFATQAAALAVTNDDQYAEAGTVLKQIKALRKEIGNVFDPIIKKAHAAHKEAVARKRETDAPLVEADRTLRGRMGEYYQEQERKRREEEAANLAAARKAEEERQLRMAELAEANGETELAEEILAADPAPVVAVPSAPKPTAENVHTQQTWKFRITDEAKIPRKYLMIDTKKIGQIVRAMKSETDIPGIEAYAESSVRVR